MKSLVLLICVLLAGCAAENLPEPKAFDFADENAATLIILDDRIKASAEFMSKADAVLESGSDQETIEFAYRAMQHQHELMSVFHLANQRVFETQGEDAAKQFFEQQMVLAKKVDFSVMQKFLMKLKDIQERDSPSEPEPELAPSPDSILEDKLNPPD